MTTDERLDALAFTVENLAGLMKDSIEKQDRHDQQIQTLTEDLRALTGVVVEMREQAEADRRETRQAVEAMLRIAESLEATAKGLVQAQQGTSQRVDRLERRVDMLESSDAA